jgi:hypothetical protein
MKNFGPFSFEEPTVIGDIFLAMIKKTALGHVPLRAAFRFNGIPPHCYRSIRAFLYREFTDRWIRRGKEGEGHSLALSFSRLDSNGFFCGFVKDIVYLEKGQNVKEMRDRIISTEDYVTN